MKNIKKLMALFIGILLVLGLLGCGQGQQEGAEQQNNEIIQIKGSDTEVNLVQRLAEEFMEDSKIKLAVTGGGSGVGISALINNQVDIANASRTMKDEEIKQAEEEAVEPVRFVIAMDGLAVIANGSNKIDELTTEQLGRIFRGEITNWQEVGGKDQKISLYGRQSNSGTFVFFRDAVLKGDYSADMKRMNGNAQIVEAVKADEAGIGYVGVGYVVAEDGNPVEGLKIIKVAKDDSSPAVSPLQPENVKDGTYPLARPLNQYVNGKPAGSILEFIKYELSEEGQKIVVEEGFYPISPEYSELNQRNLQ
ncbi:MAG: phosphate ABC transporter substrate-binding protein [Halanaerobium sp.]|nr:phosphate ABC transporter substrate-binding protein [Halanaerobium sp.]